ncbi:cytokine-dependent hematopoietic cell linker [Ornithorhynchus anatinus]|uniref:cytokine-dependent hematopoietic cell linker n=1 Tax=Ornithorhynchus anatinus TaxID=9258 RepID=UPI0019D4CC20|nr:cytokine-dependent hematopoietic cell linker [Ornithorhynchus anatinus]XP_039767601.1 cytokine-dependent hematopoietic cell linker [Ornithorhynchus anatinus]
MQNYKQISEEIRSRNAKGMGLLGTKPKPISCEMTREKEIRQRANPLPPPRSPNPQPKKYQSLPPDTGQGSLNLHQRHINPERGKGTRPICLKDLSGALGREKDPKKPELSIATQQPNCKYLPVPSSSFTVNETSYPTSGQKLNANSRSPSPAKCKPLEQETLSTYENQKGATFSNPNQRAPARRNWYIGECSRREVERALLTENSDGTFLVRDYSKKSTAEPYVLALLYQNKVYNIKIRFLERSRQYALGTGLRGDEKFDSVEDIIEHYRYSPITLIDGKDKTGNNREQCYLTHPLPFRKHPHFPSSR